MNQNPLVSIIMPCFNAAPFIRESIGSVLSQSYPFWELLIINDGCTDGTSTIIKEFIDKRIRCIDLESNHGIAYCRKLGIREAKGEFIFWLDADDIALSQRLAVQLEVFNANNELVLCATNADCLKGDVVLQRKNFKGETSEQLKSRFFFAFPFVNSSVALRSSAVKKIREVEQVYKQAEDYILYTQLLSEGDFILLKDPVVQYRVHDSETRITGEHNNREIVRGRMIAWKKILELLKLQTKDEILEVHDKMTYYPNRITEHSQENMIGYVDLLTLMINANNRLGIFDRGLFFENVAHMIYTTVMHPAVPLAKSVNLLIGKFRFFNSGERLKMIPNKIRRTIRPHIKLQKALIISIFF